jgi:hypothetical protein
MGNCVIIESQNNTRLILELAHERNEKLVSYIRLTDAAIWGFLGIATINLFGTNNFPSTNIRLFWILVILSMFLWRLAVNNYQKDIVKGYYQIVICENTLRIPYHISVRKNLENSIMSNPFIHHKPQTFRDLCELLTPEKYIDKKDTIMKNIALFFGYSEKYTDKYHIYFNWIAVGIGLFAFFMVCLYFFNIQSQLCII